jgi:uncharacterized protein (DUF1697 family)
MASHVALLRGINVGGRNKVPMAELREVVASLGYTGVTTYIQSGNVLFTTQESDTGKLASALEAAITGAFGLWASVVVMTRDELARILDRNPYPDEPRPQFVHVVFLNAEPPADLVDKIKAAESTAAAKGGRDTVTALGPALYLHTPDGFGTSELAQMVFRIIGTPRQTAAGATGGPVPPGHAAAGGTKGVVRPGKHGIAATARNLATATKLLSLCEDK